MVIKIDTKDLEIGMYVVRLDRAWLETPFLLHKFHIKDHPQIAQLREYCQFVYIDTEKGPAGKAATVAKGTYEQIIDERNGSDQSETDVHRPSSEKIIRSWNRQRQLKREALEGTETSSFQDEVHRAIKIQEQVKTVIDRILHEVRMGMSVATSEAKKAVTLVVDSVLRNRDALVCLTQLRERDEYTTRHSVNVCALCAAFGRFLGFDREKLQAVGMGALLHDVGKMKVPLEILNKPANLTEEEFSIVKKHVEYGLEVLHDSKGMNDDSLEMIAQHHERSDGNGYPSRLTVEQICLLGGMAAIADVYDAITTDRVYRSHMTPHNAIKSMFQWGEKEFNKRLLESFIRCMGIYPAGSLLCVNDALIGVVIAANQDDALKPKILIVMDENRQEYASPLLIDLANKKNAQKYVITSVLDPIEENINVKALMGYMLEAVAT